VLDWSAISSTSTLTALPVGVMLVRLLMAGVYGLCVAGVYRLSHGRLRGDASILIATLVLLSLLIAMVSMVIGDSVARAFSLVGALSIVRFRTVVEDTRDTAFVIFAVIVGMAAGAGSLVMPLLGIPLVGMAAILLSRIAAVREAGSAATCLLTVRLGLGRDPEQTLVPVVSNYASSQRIERIETAKAGAALELTYRLTLRPDASMANLVAELNRTEGVQYVELETETGRSD